MTARVFCVVLLCLSGCLSSTEAAPEPTLTEVKPEVCPSRDYAIGVCAEFCSDDSDCGKNEKCCSNGCGHECTPLYPAVKPGVCPRRLYTPKECTWIRFVSCRDDSNCPKNEKCCYNGCGLQCMAPVKVKPGLCPRKKYDANICLVIRFKPCVDDSDCANKQKCCSNGCGLQCMDPV